MRCGGQTGQVLKGVNLRGGEHTLTNAVGVWVRALRYGSRIFFQKSVIAAAAGVGEVMEDNNEETSQQGSEAKDLHVEATAFGFQSPW